MCSAEKLLSLIKLLRSVVFETDLDEAVRLMSPDNMMLAAGRPWNKRGAMPLHNWLCGNQTAEDEMRLKCLGNIVIPRCAQLGLHQLVHFLRSQA